MPLHIVHNNIVDMETDAIVNAANSKLLSGGGVCGAIFNKANSQELHKECEQLAPVPVGEAVITKGYHLKAKYIIHAVGPIYQDGLHHEKELLENAYKNALKCAIENQCQSISFPLISSGIYGYPKTEALEVAISTISHFLFDHDLDVYIVVYDKQTVQLSEKLFNHVKHYIDSYYVETRRAKPSAIYFFEEDTVEEATMYDSYIECPKMSSPLDELIENIQHTFSETLLHIIDEKQYSDVEVYKRANMDRKLFSKIRSQKDYHPSKRTALSLAIALKLSVKDAISFLETAGYSLSNSQKQDVIVRYFLENHEYDIHKINETLFYFDEATL